MSSRKKSVGAIVESIKPQDLAAIQKRVSANSEVITNIAQQMVSRYCDNLDNYIRYVDEVVANGEQPATNEELEDFVLNIPTLLYFASEGLEEMGIQEDTSKAIRMEKYNESYAIYEGTIADKQAAAELTVQAETLVWIAYQRAYKLIKQRVEAGYETLSSVKKVLTKRMLEIEKGGQGGFGSKYE